MIDNPTGEEAMTDDPNSEKARRQRALETIRAAGLGIRVTPATAAAMLGIGRSTLYERVDAGTLPAPLKYPDGFKGYPSKHLEAYAETGHWPAPEPPAEGAA